jgi:hypothetical protein
MTEMRATCERYLRAEQAQSQITAEWRHDNSEATVAVDAEFDAAKGELIAALLPAWHAALPLLARVLTNPDNEDLSRSPKPGEQRYLVVSVSDAREPSWATHQILWNHVLAVELYPRKQE